MTKLYVVTDSELGWSCLIGVFDTFEGAEQACKPDAEDYASDPEYYNSITDGNGKYETRHIHKAELNYVW